MKIERIALVAVTCINHVVHCSVMGIFQSSLRITTERVICTGYSDPCKISKMKC